MALICLAQSPSPEFAHAVEQTVRELTRLRAEVRWHTADTWPQDTRTITDLRPRPNA